MIPRAVPVVPISLVRAPGCSDGWLSVDNISSVIAPRTTILIGNWFVLFGFHTPHIGITALCKAKQGSSDPPPNDEAHPLNSPRRPQVSVARDAEDSSAAAPRRAAGERRPSSSPGAAPNLIAACSSDRQEQSNAIGSADESKASVSYRRHRSATGPPIGKWKKCRQWISSRPNGERRSPRVSRGRPRLTLRCSGADEACCVGADPCYLPLGALSPAARDEVDLVLRARVGQGEDMAPHDQQPLDDKFEE